MHILNGRAGSKGKKNEYENENQEPLKNGSKTVVKKERSRRLRNLLLGTTKQQQQYEGKQTCKAKQGEENGNQTSEREKFFMFDGDDGDDETHT